MPSTVLKLIKLKLVLFKRILKVTPFPRTVSATSVSILSLTIYHYKCSLGGIVHLPDYHIPFWNTVPVRSATSNGQMKTIQKVQCLQIKLLWFKHFLPYQRLAKAL